MRWYFPSPSIPQPQQYQSQRSYSDIRAEEDAAAQEASRKSRIEAQNRQGSRTNLLTGAELMSTFGDTPTARKNLLGVQANA